MRVLHGGVINAIGSLFGGGSPSPQPFIYQQPQQQQTPPQLAPPVLPAAPAPLGPSTEQIQAEKDAANAEAKRKQDALVNSQSTNKGAFASLYTPPALEDTFSSNPVSRKTLFGG